MISQDVSIYPTGSNCVDQALDTVQHIHRILLNKIGTAGQGATGTVGGIGTGTGVLGDKEKEKEKSMIQVTPDCGCLRVSLPSVDEAVKVLLSVFLYMFLLFLPCLCSYFFLYRTFFSI